MKFQSAVQKTLFEGLSAADIPFEEHVQKVKETYKLMLDSMMTKVLKPDWVVEPDAQLNSMIDLLGVKKGVALFDKVMSRAVDSKYVAAVMIPYGGTKINEVALADLTDEDRNEDRVDYTALNTKIDTMLKILTEGAGEEE